MADDYKRLTQQDPINTTPCVYFVPLIQNPGCQTADVTSASVFFFFFDNPGLASPGTLGEHPRNEILGADLIETIGCHNQPSHMEHEGETRFSLGSREYARVTQRSLRDMSMQKPHPRKKACPLRYAPIVQ